MKHEHQEITVDKKSGRIRVRTMNNEPSMTQQQFKEECDINNIMKKYATTGVFTHLTSKEGRYADFSQITDYQEMLETVRYADEAFMQLPADVRLRFKNNPAELLEFVQDPKNYDEGVKLGLLNKKDIPATEIKNDLNDKKPEAVKTEIK